MSTIRYLVEVNGVEQAVAPDGLLEDYLEGRPGQSLSATTYLQNADTSRAYGSSDYGTGAYGNPSARYRLLQAMIEDAGPAAAGTDQAGQGWFVDRVPNNSTLSSALVGVEPVDLPEMPSLWAIIQGGDDETAILGSQAQLTHNLFVIATYDDYQNRSDVVANLETSLL